MLVELAVRDLGVIAEARIPFDPGMTVLTGETGAGKTMVVEALRLLSGGKADPSRVRSGATEAVVEALFAVDDTEWAVRRVVPASGRSRSYLNGELVTANELGRLAGGLLEIHGQHSQQSLLDRRHQRLALDRFAGADTTALARVRSEVASLRSELDSLGGDERARRRRLDLLEYQIAEIEAVAPSVGEEDALARSEDVLAGALGHRDTADEVAELLGAEGAALDLLARAGAMLGGSAPFDEIAPRIIAATEEVSDALSELRTTAESIEPDEERLAEVRGRRQAIIELRRKYGETVAGVLEYLAQARTDLAVLEGLDEKRASVASALARAQDDLAAVAARLGEQRRRAAPDLAASVAEVLRGLALGVVSMEVAVEDTDELPGAGEAVEIRLSTNPGMRPGPLSRVASGGELSRMMLALRLVLSGGPPTMVFDEVDAGIGGEAAVAVGAALGSLAASTQVMVVTHLAQVAAFADAQVLVSKRRDSTLDAVDAGEGRTGADEAAVTDGDDPAGADLTTVTSAQVVDADERVIELSRMLSGSPDSETARVHAEELLRTAAAGHPAVEER